MDVFVPVSQFVKIDEEGDNSMFPYVNKVDFLLGWGTEGTGDRGRLPAGLFIWKKISYSSDIFSLLILRLSRY